LVATGISIVNNLMSFAMLLVSVLQALASCFEKAGIIAAMIYDFCIGKSPLFIGVRGFIVEGLPRIAPVCRK
jgi:hypothetical protein